MTGVVGVVALLTVLGLSLVITRIATVALMHTGLSHDAARLQARSAFTGTGFTTREAEKVVDHPVRRRIIMLLMVLRSAGLVTIIISLILSFAGDDSGPDRLFRLALIAAGVLVLWALAKSRFVDRILSRAISRALSGWTDLDVRDYSSLLKLSGDYSVTELRIRKNDWLEGKSLSECRLDDEGVRVLGLQRSNGRQVGAPKADTKVHEGDTIVLYGHVNTLSELDTRRSDEAGERAHRPRSANRSTASGSRTARRNATVRSGGTEAADGRTFRDRERDQPPSLRIVSILAARMKSLSVSPSILWVQIFTPTLPQARYRSG